MREPNCVCDQCRASFFKRPCDMRRTKNNFCCLECSRKFQDKRIEVVCLACGKVFFKEQCELRRTKRNCCSKECSKILNKYYKDWGSKRSKLEIAIEEFLKDKFTFEIIYNKTSIGYELDIHIPSLNLAIEINGILHYKPIYGIEKLLRVQQIDGEKILECKKRNIHLIVINVSEDRNTKSIRTQRTQEVFQIINNRIEELICNKEVQITQEA